MFFVRMKCAIFNIPNKYLLRLWRDISTSLRYNRCALEMCRLRDVVSVLALRIREAPSSDSGKEGSQFKPMFLSLLILSRYVSGQFLNYTTVSYMYQSWYYSPLMETSLFKIWIINIMYYIKRVINLLYVNESQIFCRVQGCDVTSIRYAPRVDIGIHSSWMRP
jgi:hypothetical protein